MWEGTQALLIAVYPESVEQIKNRYTAFWRYDTKFSGRREYYDLNFENALILVFIHLNTGIPFTTIRRNHELKLRYYTSKIGDTFLLKRTG